MFTIKRRSRCEYIETRYIDVDDNYVNSLNEYLRTRTHIDFKVTMDDVKIIVNDWEPDFEKLSFYSQPNYQDIVYDVAEYIDEDMAYIEYDSECVDTFGIDTYII